MELYLYFPYLYLHQEGLDVGIASCWGWMVWRLNPGVGTRLSVPVETGPGAHLTSCVVGTGFLSRG